MSAKRIARVWQGKNKHFFCTTEKVSKFCLRSPAFFLFGVFCTQKKTRPSDESFFVDPQWIS